VLIGWVSEWGWRMQIDDYDRSFEIETVKWKIKGSEVQINQLKEKLLQR